MRTDWYISPNPAGWYVGAGHVPAEMAEALRSVGMARPNQYSDAPEWARLAWVCLPENTRLGWVVRAVVGAGAEESVVAAHALGGRPAVEGLLRSLLREARRK